MPEARTRLVALLLGRYYFRPRVVWLCCCCALAQAVLRFYPVSVPLQSRKGSLICVVRPILMRLVFAGYLLPGAKRKYACALLARPPRLMGRGSSTTQPMPGSVCFAPEATNISGASTLSQQADAKVTVGSDAAANQRRSWQPLDSGEAAAELLDISNSEEDTLR